MLRVTRTQTTPTKEINLGAVGALPNDRSFKLVRQGRNCQRCKHRFRKINLQPNQAAICHMEHVMGRWQESRPDKHPKRLMGANGRQIELNSTVFLILTLGDALSNQLVCGALKVTCPFLSQRARKELRTVYPNFPKEGAETGQGHCHGQLKQRRPGLLWQIRSTQLRREARTREYRQK